MMKQHDSRVRFALALGVLAGMLGCHATFPPATTPETVGQLAAGPSVWSAPVHPATDLTPQFGAVDTGDDSVTETVTTVSRAPDASAPDAGGTELPDVAPKGDGVTLGTVRP